MSLRFNHDEWLEISIAARRAASGILGEALRLAIGQRYSVAQTDLERPGRTNEEMRVSQGETKAHKRDILILEDLTAMAERAMSPGNKEH